MRKDFILEETDNLDFVLALVRRNRNTRKKAIVLISDFLGISKKAAKEIYKKHLGEDYEKEMEKYNSHIDRMCEAAKIKRKNEEMYLKRREKLNDWLYDDMEDIIDGEEALPSVQ